MYIKTAKRFLKEADKRLPRKLFWTPGIKGAGFVILHKKSLNPVEHSPSSLYTFVINNYNLRPQSSRGDVKSKQQRKIHDFVVINRVRKPIGVVDAYYDHEGQARCPTTTGINPYGDIDQCPNVQCAKGTIDDERGIKNLKL